MIDAVLLIALGIIGIATLAASERGEPRRGLTTVVDLPVVTSTNTGPPEDFDG